MHILWEKAKPWLLDIVAICSGAISLFAFAPFGWYGLMPISIGALFLLLQFGSIARATWRGWLYGLGAYGIGMVWLYAIAEHVAAMDGVNPVVVGILTGILLLVMLAPLLIALFYRLLVKHIPRHALWAHVLGFSAVWVFIEWLRSWLFTGFPLLQPGYALVETPLAAWAPIGSVLAVTFVLVLLTVLLVFNLRQSLARQQRISSFLVAGAVIGLSVWLTPFAWTKASDQSLHARLIHGATDQIDKYKRYKVIDTVKDYLRLSGAEPKPDLIVWPEAAISFALRDVYYLVAEPARLLREAGTTLLMGSYVDGKRHMLNALLDAAYPERFYAKRHLVPYGEYTPSLWWLDFNDYLPQAAMNELETGEHIQPLLEANGIPLATTICFENLFGHEQRHDWRQAQFLVQVSDLAWFVHTWAAEQLLQVSQMRARESGKPLLQSTNHGVSAVIDRFGHIVDRRSTADTQVLDARITPRTGATPYTQWADVPLGLLVFGCVLFVLWQRWRLTGAED